jgi:hypothetical protein
VEDLILEERGGAKSFAKRLNAATAGGLLGLVAGKVKQRDQIAITAAVVLFGIAVIKSEGLLIGIAVAVAICVAGGLLIRLRKWKVGAPRSSTDY